MDMRLAWIATRFPPIPLMTGWKTASPWNRITARSRIKPPALEISIEKITGDHPVRRTTLVSGLCQAIAAKIGVSETNKAMINRSTVGLEVSLSHVADSANSVNVVRSPISLLCALHDTFQASTFILKVLIHYLKLAHCLLAYLDTG